ncbi:hypothetical protein [Burkholderia metallica]|uniref:hypothetical protein n=1 Tax=Burkholderia metallica TaxID=488729 RepID=UPI0014542C76|nr:hypothetical protein [Burkholderia metallica]VWC34088.1 hypothetical protein BME24068_06564 [Burkholderia metallica]
MMLNFLNAAVSTNLIALAMAAFIVLMLFLTTDDISKTGAILCGSFLIAEAGVTAYQIQVHWLPIAEATTASNIAARYRMSPEQVKAFTSSANFFLWIIPFVTASWGTNIISDAIGRNFTYREKWSVPRNLWKIITLILGALLWLLLLPTRLVRRSGAAEIEAEHNATRYTPLRRSSRILIPLLAELPQFHREGFDDELVNLLDGSIVRFVRPEDDEFGCYLSVKWPNQPKETRVDGDRYVQLQIRTASILGHDTTGLRQKAQQSIDEILGI